MNDKANQLKTLLLKKGKKICWVAKQIGYTPAYVSYLIHGKRTLTDNLYNKIKKALLS